MSNESMSAGQLLKQANRLKREGRLDEAIALYYQAIEINPNFAWAYNNLGDALVKQGKLDEAVVEYRQAIEINPSSAWFYYQLGELLFQQSNLTEALKYYRQAIEINPNFAHFFYSLGLVLAQQGNLDEAVQYLQQAIKIKPDCFKFSHKLIEYAQAAMATSNWLVAIKLWNMTIENQGDNASANTYAQLSLAYRKIRALDTAEAVVSKGMKKYSNDIALDSEFAEIAIAKKKQSEAIFRLQDLLIKYNKSHPIVKQSIHKLLRILLNDKIWLYSLMKSGTTYTLLVLANYVLKNQGISDEIDFESLNNYGIIHGLNVYEILKNKQIINNLVSSKTDYPIYHTHTYVDTNFKKSIMLTRNPLDFIVSSYFFHFKNRGENLKIQEVIDSRIKHFSTTYLSQKKILTDSPKDSIIISYEQLMTETKSVFTKIVNHLGLELSDSVLKSSIDACSVDNVKKMEKKQGKPLVVGKKLQVESFIRSGRIGEWKEHLSESDLHKVAKQLRNNGVNPQEFEELKHIF